MATNYSWPSRRFPLARRPRVGLSLAAAFLAVALALPASAAVPNLLIYRVDNDAFPLVRAYATLLGPGNDPMPGVNQDSLVLLEDGQRVARSQVDQTVDHTVLIDTFLVVDTSGSMKDDHKLDTAKLAARAFLTTLRAGDRVGVLAFSEQPRVVQGLTTNGAAVLQALDGLQPKGDTALYDSVVEASKQLGSDAPPSGPASPRRVVVLFTDGEDTASKLSLQKSLGMLADLGVPVVAIGLGADARMDLLDQLAGATAGQTRFLAASDVVDNVTVPLFISEEDALRRVYRVTYTSDLPSDGSSHRLDLSGTYGSQSVQASASFVARSLQPTLVVTGLTDLSTVSGSPSIHVDVSPAGPGQAQLLVDSQARASADQLPADLIWDTAGEKAGLHRVTVRVAVPSGAAPLQQSFDVVFSLPPVATATPVATPTQLPATPTPVPPPVPTPSFNLWDHWYEIFTILAALVASTTWFAILYLREPPPPAIERAVDIQVDDLDRTEIIPPLAPVGVPARSGAEAPVGAAPVATAPNGEALADDLPTIVPGPPLLAPPLARLRVVENGGEREVALVGAETIVGRDRTSVVVIPDARVSRQHARIVIQDNEYWIEDLHSHNGTRVNGENITRRRLSGDDRIQIGDALITFTLEAN